MVHEYLYESELMSLEKKLRTLIALAMIVLAVVGVAAVLYLTDILLDVSAHLAEAPFFLKFLYWGAILMGVLAIAWSIYRLLRPANKPETGQISLPDEMDAAGMAARLDRAEATGIDVAEARRELERLAQGNAAGTLALALVGNISTGKSSLIKALIPGANPVIDVGGGSTRGVNRYQWRADSGDVLELVDLPGLSEAAGTLEQITLDEALRSHLIVFVCEGDLSRDEYQALAQLLMLEKPLVAAINKKDRFCEGELAGIRERLRERVGLEHVPVVAISAGGSEIVMRVDANGEQRQTQRTRATEIDELLAALERLLDGSPEALRQLRDRAVFFLVESRLQKARSAHLDEAGADLVRTYTRRAVIGALAAVSPGTDILIQGYLGAGMVKALCKLHGVSARKLDIDNFLNFSQRHIGRTFPLMLAVAGNGLKAFPGVGTLTGGLVHAVAYGMIFDSLGNSLRQTLDQRGEFLPGMAAAGFEEKLGENLESRSGALAKLAVETIREGLVDQRGADQQREDQSG